MILIDIAQLAFANLFEQISGPQQKVEIDLFRPMVLNTLRSTVLKFKSEYGPEIVIACDNKNYWRRKIFPYYKFPRKKIRESSGYDWHSIYENLAVITDEIKEFSPYKVLDVENAEADDIIACLVHEYSKQERILIVSMDSDFVQLQKYSDVEQYSISQKRFIKEQLPIIELKRKIICGDRGDGIPSILSSDDTFVNGVRQKPITQNKLIDWLNKSPEEFCNEEMLRNYSRNQLLIDFDYIPVEIKQEILTTYKNTKGKSKNVFLNYLISRKLPHLISEINDF